MKQDTRIKIAFFSFTFLIAVGFFLFADFSIVGMDILSIIATFFGSMILLFLYIGFEVFVLEK